MMSDEERKRMSEARKGVNNNFFGKHHSIESRIKISEANKGKHHHSEEHNQRMRELFKGRVFSEDWKRKISEAKMGHSVSEDVRRKLSIAHKGVNHPFWGKHLSEEHRRKISDSHKGKKVSEEELNRLRTINIGRHHSDEIRRRNSESHKGIVRSEETRKRMGEAKRGNKNMLGKHHSKETKQRMHDTHTTPQAIEDKRERRLHMIIPNKDTKPEVKLQELCSSLGLEFVKHYPVLGQPDIYIPSKNLLIFEDGTFYHADPREYKSEDIIWKKHGIVTAQTLWDRDKRVTDTLVSRGFKVLRFWEREVNKDIEGCRSRILEAISGLPLVMPPPKT